MMLGWTVKMFLCLRRARRCDMKIRGSEDEIKKKIRKSLKWDGLRHSSHGL